MDLSRNLEGKPGGLSAGVGHDTNDVILRHLVVGGKKAAMIFIDGLINEKR